MSKTENCPKCGSEDTYQDGPLWICPSCGNEWMPTSTEISTNLEAETDSLVRDANGAVLNTGDSVIVIKELKIKGSNSAVKVGTKVKNIRLIDAGDGHNIACKIDGLGSINLKSEFVKKA